MNTPSNSPTRPMYWSVLRELWENRSIFIAPVSVAAFVLSGVVISSFLLSDKARAQVALNHAKLRGMVALPYTVSATFLIFTGFIVAGFYCLEALHSERQDRSILFWKSLPVSDLTTVLSKASIPLVVVPLVTFAVIIATHLVMLLMGIAVRLIDGVSPAMASPLPLFQWWPTLLYGLAAMALWDAPIYGWLLLVSGWARRAAFLWAVLPFVALGAVEMIAFQTTYIGSFLKYRGMGWTTEAFVSQPRGSLLIDPLNPPDPGKFLSSPNLLIGLAFAAVFLVAAVRLRRYREPL